MIKIVLLLCRSRYRKKNLNNFCKINFFGKYLIISFSFVFYYFGLILSRLKIFKTISKYVETLQRSNEQLVKVASLVSKKESSSDTLSAKEMENIYSAIQSAPEDDDDAT